MPIKFLYPDKTNLPVPISTSKDALSSIFKTNTFGSSPSSLKPALSKLNNNFSILKPSSINC